MRVLVDIRLLSKGRTSGVEEYAVNLLPELFSHAPEATFTLFYNALRRAPLPPLDRGAPNVTTITRRIPNKLLDLSARLLRFPTAETFARTDIVYTPHLNLFPVGSNAARIITFHDLSFIHYPEFFPLRKRFWHWLQNCRSEATRAAAIVVDSEFTKADVAETLRVDPERIHVIYPGVRSSFGDVRASDAAVADFARRHRLETPFLLSVGVVEPRKNVPVLVRAFERLTSSPSHRDVKLVIVGGLGWRYRETIRAIERSPRREGIVRWGAATPEDLQKLYALAGVFVYPSFFEGFGFPPLEAQASGVPVVVSNRSSLPEVIGNSGLLVNPWNPSEVAAAAGALLTDSALRTRFIARGRENVRRFSWPAAARRLVEVFRSVSS